MATLHALITHQGGREVERSVELLQAVAPDSRVVVFHGGRREQFEEISLEEKVFLEDPDLRGAPRHLQSWTEVFERAWERWVRDDPEWDSLYLFEYDHLVLRADFEARLRELAAATRADFMGKNCVERTATNWEHYIRYRADPLLLEHLRRVSVREDPTTFYGCLGNGMWLSRRALGAYVAVNNHPPCYNETYVPTLMHHLGMKVVDVDAHSDLYRTVRWVPEFTVQEVIEIISDGGVFVHPVKDPTVGEALRTLGASAEPAGIGTEDVSE